MAFYFFVEAEISSSTVSCTSLLKLVLTTTTCSTEVVNLNLLRMLHDISRILVALLRNINQVI